MISQVYTSYFLFFRPLVDLYLTVTLIAMLNSYSVVNCKSFRPTFYSTRLRSQIGVFFHEFFNGADIWNMSQYCHYSKNNGHQIHGNEDVFILFITAMFLVFPVLVMRKTKTIFIFIVPSWLYSSVKKRILWYLAVYIFARSPNERCMN